MKKITAVVAAAVLAGSAGAVIARATARDSSQITACVEAKTGYLYLAKSCSGSSLTWNQIGPQGPPGTPGPAGPQGPPGTFHLAAVNPQAYQRAVQDLTGAGSLLAVLDHSISIGAGDTAAYRRRFVSLDVRMHRARTIPATLTALEGLDELNSEELQAAMDRQAKWLETLSNAMKKLADTSSAILDAAK
jgi:hypothetical protein